MRKLTAWLSFVFICLLLSSCVMQPPPQQPPVSAASAQKETQPEQTHVITIAVIPKSLDNPVFLDAREQCIRVSQEMGFRLEWLAPMKADAGEQEAIVESLIIRKVDGIVISCIDPDSMKNAINRAIEAGIKVATFDSDSPDSNRLFYCGTDNYAAGKACATALYNVLVQKNKLGDEHRILIMTADPDSFNLSERLRGFNDVSKELGLNLVNVNILYCRDDINLAGDLLEMAVKTSSFDVFFSTGGWPLILPPESLPNFVKWCHNGGTSVVVDTFYPMIVAAKMGMADALVGQDFAKMGELSVRYLYRAIVSGQNFTTFIDTGLEFADPQNYDLLLQTKKPWDFK